ncbi:MAG: DNA double-strand break repair nuclease NurA [Ignisphaera sp.]
MLHEDEEISGKSIELTDENPELTTALVEAAKDIVSKVYASYAKPALENRDKIRRFLEIRRFPGSAEQGGRIVVAVDSTWSKPTLEVVSGVFGVIVSGYVVVGPSGTSSYEICRVSSIVGNSEKYVNTAIEVYAKTLEYDTALKALDKHSYADMVMLDGSLYFSTRPSFFNPAKHVDESCLENIKEIDELISIGSSKLLRLFKKASDLGIPVVGVVKRVSSRFIASYIEELDNELARLLRRLNDKVILSYVLEPGEFTVISSYLDIFKKHLNIMKRSSKASKQKRIQAILDVLETCSSGKAVDELKNLCDVMRETAIVFYKPVSDMVYPQAIRLDVYPRSRIEEVIEYVTHNTSQNAVPIPIDYADRFIRLETASLKRLYRLIMAYGAEAGGDAQIALGLTNPQKSYLFT